MERRTGGGVDILRREFLSFQNLITIIHFNYNDCMKVSESLISNQTDKIKSTISEESFFFAQRMSPQGGERRRIRTGKSKRRGRREWD
jgi:hypothetical protein